MSKNLIELVTAKILERHQLGRSLARELAEIALAECAKWLDNKPTDTDEEMAANERIAGDIYASWRKLG